MSFWSIVALCAFCLIGVPVLTWCVHSIGRDIHTEAQRHRQQQLDQAVQDALNRRSLASEGR